MDGVSIQKAFCFRHGKLPHPSTVMRMPFFEDCGRVGLENAITSQYCFGIGPRKGQI